MTVLSESTPTARKDHHCDVCGGTIRTGTQHKAVRCVGDGHVFTWRAHTTCDEVYNKVWVEVRQDIYPEDFDFWESVEDVLTTADLDNVAAFNRTAESSGGGVIRVDRIREPESS